MVFDVRYALRLLAKRAGWTVLMAVALALGISTAAIGYAIVDALRLNPLPYPDAERLVVFHETSSNVTLTGGLSVRPIAYIEWRNRLRSYDGLGAVLMTVTTLLDSGTPEEIDVARLSPGAMELLGRRPLLGRSFQPHEGQSGRDDVIVLSHRLWERRFGSDAAVLGRTVTLGKRVHTIIGVMPAGFRFPERYVLSESFRLDAEFETDAWVPLVFSATEARSTGDWNLTVFGRLQGDEPSGVSMKAAREELTSAVNDLRRGRPDAFDGSGAGIERFADHVVRRTWKPVHAVLVLGGGFILMMAFLNVLNTLLAQFLDRRHEVAVRLAVGASRGQLIRQLIVEHGLLVGCGAALSLPLILSGSSWLRTFAPSDVPRLHDIQAGGRTLVFVGIVVLLLTTAFVLASSMVLWRRDDRRGTTSVSPLAAGPARVSGRRHGPGVMVIVQTATSMVLLVGFLLMAVTYVKLSQVDPGFDAAHVLSGRIRLDVGQYPTPQAWRSAYDRIVEALQQAPGVEAVALISRLPTTGRADLSDTVIQSHLGAVTHPVEYRLVTPDYFRVLRIPLRDGRMFTNADTDGTLPVTIVSASLAMRYWPGQHPIGRTMQRGNDVTRVVVGVVADVRNEALDSAPPPQAYIPYPQRMMPFAGVVLRTASPPDALADEARRAVAGVDMHQAFSEIAPLDAVMAASIADRRFLLRVFECFSIAAILLTTTGIFGVVSYSVRRRTRELGVRMALGATRRGVFLLILRGGMVLVMSGIILGVLGAVALGRFLRHQLYQTSPTDPVLYVMASGAICAVGFLALYLPARWGASVEPASTLRVEHP